MGPGQIQNVRPILYEGLRIRVVQPNQRIQNSAEKKKKKTSMEMIGILPRYNTMKCQLQLMSGTPY